MKADLITRFRNISEDGTGIEMAIWLVHEPVPPSEHKYKYRLVYIENGRRVVGFDNERGKGVTSMWVTRKCPMCLPPLTG